MDQAKYSLSMPNHIKNISAGLSSLQQNSEFVDMTLAADGHVVKVHQFLMALASPYLKEIIKSVECPHPVIVLNNISYDTLCGILQYIYTGEVHVSPENITDLLEAAKSLHIVGLEVMDFENNQTIATSNQKTLQSLNETRESSNVMENITICNATDQDVTFEDEPLSDVDDTDDITTNLSLLLDKSGSRPIPVKSVKYDTPLTVQYTMSNRGSLQIICNRYIYFHMYTYKDKNLQKWRCVDFRNQKCPAQVVTRDNMVVKRLKVHSHPFHDRRILKKTESRWVFTALQEAESAIHRSSNNSENHDSNLKLA